MRRPLGDAALLVAVLGGAALASDCGPIEYIASVPGDASGAIEEAKHVNAAFFRLHKP